MNILFTVIQIWNLNFTTIQIHNATVWASSFFGCAAVGGGSEDDASRRMKTWFLFEDFFITPYLATFEIYAILRIILWGINFLKKNCMFRVFWGVLLIGLWLILFASGHGFDSHGHRPFIGVHKEAKVTTQLLTEMDGITSALKDSPAQVMAER